MSDRKIALLVLALISALGLGLGVALAWHTHQSNLASAVSRLTGNR